jgi:hypothetical protein
MSPSDPHMSPRSSLAPIAGPDRTDVLALVGWPGERERTTLDVQAWPWKALILVCGVRQSRAPGGCPSSQSDAIDL